MPALLIRVHFHEGRYHGRPDWPPSPARLFQALVAGAAQSNELALDNRDAFTWLETLEAPIIFAPAKRDGQGFTNYVPNNDRDSVEKKELATERDYLKEIGKIKTPKFIKPILFDATTPFIYAWTYEASLDTTAHAGRILSIAETLYQLGRGVDMAWASGEILHSAEIETLLAAYDGTIHRPGSGTSRTMLDVPIKGSLKSLIERHRKMLTRFQTLYEAKLGKREPSRKVEIGQVFTKPPQLLFRQISYKSPVTYLAFELKKPNDDSWPWPLSQTAYLVELVRRHASDRMTRIRQSDGKLIDRIFIGRGAMEADKAQRLRIVPLPSIGSVYADHQVRRVLVEIPANCPLPVRELETAFSALDMSKIDAETGEVLQRAPTLVSTAFAETMFQHYGINQEGQLWRSVTPVVLPEYAQRRRIDPLRRKIEAKGGAERNREEAVAREAIHQALRHAGIDAAVTSIRVQREPFEGKGARAEAFAPGTRFAKERLWHVEIALAKPVPGPLLIGDGRYLGLGLCAPARQTQAIFAFALEGAKPATDQEGMIAHAARRAVMARVQERLGRDKALPSFFSGHEDDGAPMRRGHHAHLFYAIDLISHPARLLILAPHIAEHRSLDPEERKHLLLLEKALDGFDELRAGKAGLFKLTTLSAPADDDPFCGSSRIWVSATPYRPTHHPKRKDDVEDALIADVLTECARRNLPRPEVEVLSCHLGPRGGTQAYARLVFAVGVEGPVLLGQNVHEGAGLFHSENRDL